MNSPDPVIAWLLAEEDPSLEYLVRTRLLAEPEGSAVVRRARNAIPQGPRVQALLSGQHPDGGFGVHPYRKWHGAHWRLVSLVELQIPPAFPAAVAATEGVLSWLSSPEHEGEIQTVAGRIRAHASQEGNALAVCARLGLAQDPRVARLAESLVAWQWPDGGWNCDRAPECTHSSFYESLAPLWGLLEYHRVTGSSTIRRAAERAAELFLRHRLFRSERTGAITDPRWLTLHYPLYWHYDILQALLILSRLGPLEDPRAEEALNRLESRRLPDGRWRPGAYYWVRPGQTKGTRDVVDWGRGGPNRMITLNALRVLQASGRWPS